MVLFGQKWLYLGKVFVFGKVAVFGQSSCNRTKWLYSGKVDVFEQKWL